MDLQELKTILKDTVALAVLSDDELKEIAERVEFVHYSLGQILCRAGDEADAFYLIYSGRARVIAEKEGQEITVGLLTRGQGFGEKALLTDSRRDYTVRAASDLVAIRLAKQDFRQLLMKHVELREYFEKYLTDNSILNFVKLCTSLTPLSPDEIKRLLDAMETYRFDKDNFIINEGDAGDAMYILREGSAKVVKPSEDGKVLAHLKPGAVFGELALLTGEKRAASVIASESASVFRLGKKDFDQIIETSPKFKTALVEVASGYSKIAITEEDENSLPTYIAEDLPQAPNQLNGYKPKRARKYPALMQLSETDCGAACTAMILRYYGKHVSINRLRDLVNVSRDGATLYSVAEGAERLGFHTRGIRANYENLIKANLPAIAHWEGFHYIVLYEATATRVVVADPARGLIKMSREEFEKGWTGYLLLLTPTEKIEDVEESRTTFGRFLPMLKPYKRLLAEIFLASLILQLFGLATPIFTQVILDKALVQKNTSLLNTMLLGMILVAVFETLTSVLRYYLTVHTTRRIDMQMVVDFYRHILSLPMRYFEERKVGDILKRFNENARIREFLTGRSLNVVLDCMMLFVYLGLMFYYSISLSVVALLFIPAYALLTFAVTPIFKKQFREVFEKTAEADSQMVESVTGIGTVKATATEKRIRWKLEGLMVKSLNIQFRGGMTEITVISISQILQTMNTVILLWFGAHLVIQNQITVGQLIAFNVIVANITRPILSLIDLWREFQEINISLERLNDVFDSKPEEDLTSSNLINLPRIKGHIRFDNVTFRYPTRGDRNALQNISLEIQPGQTVALVGRSGSGKSTFANMLLRLHQPNEGRIYIDGYDLRQCSINSLRSQVGVVPQDVFLFSGTIRENIAFGEQDAPLREVVGASMLAGAHEFISELPLGYETKIGERGQSLSGGQKQRIAIARALFKKPRILIFDEATSALDTESERAIQQNLDAILKERTTFIIAHRLSTVRNADLIIVMDKGAIVEMGDHYSLMAEKGIYFYLNSQQLEG